MADFLFEIGLEEIPARMIAAAEDELARRVYELLTREHLLEPGQEAQSYSTPRRLAVLVTGVREAQADMEEHLTGPAWSIAFKNGEPGPAAQAFAKKAGVAVTELKKLETPKGEYVGASTVRKGRTAAEILTEQLPKEIAAIYWPKNMYWRAGKPERFVRPVQWMVALLGEQVIPVEFAGVTAGRATFGHRILHGNEPVEIAKPAEYLKTLEAAKVLADVEVRRQKIRKALDKATRQVEGALWREDEPLVDTVTHLTEWPAVLLGGFEHEYLALPEEVLVTVMRDHQKYFAVEDAKGKLSPYFLTVLNTEPGDEAAEIIRHGNERVLRARFNDARFFWTVDQKISLADRVDMLQAVTFHKELGSYWDKTQANITLGRMYATYLNTRGVSLDQRALDRAILLAKTDLTTELVKEFTELQGVVGGLYARAQGEGDAVANAMYWQYSPASMEDAIPPTTEGRLLGLCDRLTSLAGLFSIGAAPSGSKDPFALRRAGNSVIKILAESALPIALKELVLHAGLIAMGKGSLDVDQLGRFLEERLSFYLRESHSFSVDVVRAVLSASSHDEGEQAMSKFFGTDLRHDYFDGVVADAILRAKAVSAVRGSEDFQAVCAAFKRMKNILLQASSKGAVVGEDIVAGRFADSSEYQLLNSASLVREAVKQFEREGNYEFALEKIATLRAPVDLFFDKVMVMVEDEGVRRNRLALIQFVLESFSSIADFSEIVAG
jgi:glycyl-tRNA synthetase beta chain